MIFRWLTRVTSAETIGRDLTCVNCHLRSLSSLIPFLQTSIPCLGLAEPLVHDFPQDQSARQVPASSPQTAANSLLDSLWQVFLLLGCSHALLREKCLGRGVATAPPSVARPDVSECGQLGEAYPSGLPYWENSRTINQA
jgi:hypothetical protein